MLSNGSDTYAWLIDPLAPQEFERDYYQKRVSVVRRGKPWYYQSLLSLDMLDQVLGTHRLSPRDLQIVRSDVDTTAADYTDGNGKVSPVRAAKLFADGATLIFNQLQRRVPSLANLCSALGTTFSSRMQTNIYLTPSGSQGFQPHWDTHDVFVLQVSGSKRWKIYDTKIPLPLRGQQFDPKQYSAGETSEEFELAAGDIAYIPRGLMHSASSQAESSLHITTGLIGFTWADFLLQSVAAAALADVSLRENLPLGIARPDFPAEERVRLCREKLQQLQANIDAAPAFSFLSEELATGQTSSFTNLLSQISSVDDLELSSSMRCRPDIVFDYREDGEHGYVTFCGTRVQLPSFLAPAVQFMQTATSFTIRELPDCVDDEGKLTLAKRLLKEGLLERV